MSATVTIIDEMPSGEKTEQFTLELEESVVTVRDIIRQRIYEEVDRYNRSARKIAFEGLVRPGKVEERLNGKKDHKIDPEAQFKIALKAFQGNSFFMIVGDRQVETLDEEIDISTPKEVSFIRLVPLVGG